MNGINFVFSENLKRLRKEKCLTQNQLAQKLNVTGQAISKWENRRSAPDIFMLSNLARILSCQTDDFFIKHEN